MRRLKFWALVAAVRLSLVPFAAAAFANPSTSTKYPIACSHLKSPQKLSAMSSSTPRSDSSSGRGQRRMSEAEKLGVGLDEKFRPVVDDFGVSALETFMCQDDGDEENFRWIRIEKETDSCLKHMYSRRQVLDKIAEVRKQQAQHCQSNLSPYPRYWESVHGELINGESAMDSGSVDFNGQPINGESAKDSESVDRKPVSRTATDSTGQHEISVMQFNMLAEGLSAGPQAQTPFRVDPADSYSQCETQSYGGFSNIPNPQLCLDFSLRRWRLLEVMLGTQLDSKSGAEGAYDIIAVEEIDRYRGFFAPVLRLFGYEGVFVPKIRSPGVRMGWYSDGCALFWKKSAFEVISEQTREFSVGSQVFVIVVLRHQLTRRSFVVAVTHLKAQQSAKNELVRCRQVEELLQQVDDVATEIADQDNVHDVPVIVLGDFNAEPPSQNGQESLVGRIIERLRPSASSVGQVLGFGRKNRSTSDRHCRFHSAYKIDPPSHSYYTTWKTRGTRTARRIIDYIFFSGGLRCKATLCIPSEEELEDTKLPGLRHPSDHLNIAAKFVIE